MVVRPAVPGDAAALAAVHVRTWQAAYAGLLPQDYLDSLHPSQREPGWRQWLSEIRPPAAILAWTEAEAETGMGAAGWRPDGASKVDDSRGIRLDEVRYRCILAGSQGLRPTAP